MKFLPPATTLPTAPLVRRHAPSKEDYEKYRECLRWDFGFTCALCFLHEPDLIDGGVEGTGMIWIEHHALQSKEQEKRDSYDNCLLSCRYCNNTRSKRPATDPKTGATLLDPTKVNWGERFFLQGHTIRVRDETDPDAMRTWRLYGLGAARKRAAREIRAQRFEDFFFAEEEFAKNALDFMTRARTAPPADRDGLIAAASALERLLDQAAREIAKYVAVPDDRPDECLCDEERTLPDWLDAQTQEIQYPP